MENTIEEQTAPEKTIFNAIGQGDLAEFKNILMQHKGSVDFFDENGMTALQHAAYKGCKEMVQMLLDRVSTFYFNDITFYGNGYENAFSLTISGRGRQFWKTRVQLHSSSFWRVVRKFGGM